MPVIIYFCGIVFELTIRELTERTSYLLTKCAKTCYRKVEALVRCTKGNTHCYIWMRITQLCLIVIIDNDIYGTDVTFGFHTAVDIATDVIDRIHTTAGSHSRVMCIEIMGNKAGWLTLYSGIAGGADIILLPELPYDIDRVCEAVERRAKKGSNFSILAVAEGAINTRKPA